MLTQTQHYQLWAGMGTDDFVEPQHVDRLAATVDQTLGMALQELVSPGVYQGWELQTDKTVSAGQGLLAACWGRTAAAQSITGLTNGVLNHVFAAPTAQTAPAGVVSFAAQTNPAGPPGALYLGTIELDSQGQVVAVNNQVTGVARGVFSLRTATLSGAGTHSSVQPNQTVTLEITHAALRVPGAIEFTGGQYFSFTLEKTWQAGGFTAKVTNTDTVAHDLSYSWTRQGMAQG